MRILICDSISENRYDSHHARKTGWIFVDEILGKSDVQCVYL